MADRRPLQPPDRADRALIDDVVTRVAAERAESAAAKQAEVDAEEAGRAEAQAAEERGRVVLEQRRDATVELSSRLTARVRSVGRKHGLPDVLLGPVVDDQFRTVALSTEQGDTLMLTVRLTSGGATAELFIEGEPVTKWVTSTIGISKGSLDVALKGLLTLAAASARPSIQDSSK